MSPAQKVLIRMQGHLQDHLISRLWKSLRARLEPLRDGLYGCMYDRLGWRT